MINLVQLTLLLQRMKPLHKKKHWLDCCLFQSKRINLIVLLIMIVTSHSVWKNSPAKSSTQLTKTHLSTVALPLLLWMMCRLKIIRIFGEVLYHKLKWQSCLLISGRRRKRWGSLGKRNRRKSSCSLRSPVRRILKIYVLIVKCLNRHCFNRLNIHPCNRIWVFLTWQPTMMEVKQTSTKWWVNKKTTLTWPKETQC